jgi:predicted amidophosphoribosyltransferase
MPDDCPRCERPLTEDGHLRYCDRCAYEPPESANLPVIPPTEDDGGELTSPDDHRSDEPAVSTPGGIR